MRLKDLILHTQSVLPLFTDKFSTNISVTSVTKAGNDVTVTASNHKLKVGDQFILSNVQTNVEITSITESDKIATATTAVDHDLTVGFVSKVVVESPESAFSGTFELIETPSTTSFKFRITGTPAGSSTGTLKTFHDIGYNGVQTVTSVTDINNFVFENTDTRLTSGSGSNMLLEKDIRISGAANLDRLIDSFNENPLTEDVYGYFVFDNMTISKDRNINTDATTEILDQNDFKTAAINQFHFYVFVRVQDELSARAGIDLCQELAKPIYRTLFGYKPPNEFVADQEVIVAPIGHLLEDYIPPYLIYDFQFEITEYMISNGDPENVGEFMGNFGDTLPNLRTRAFRLFNSQILNDFDTIVKDDDFEIPAEG